MRGRRAWGVLKAIVAETAAQVLADSDRIANNLIRRAVRPHLAILDEIAARRCGHCHARTKWFVIIRT